MIHRGGRAALLALAVAGSALGGSPDAGVLSLAPKKFSWDIPQIVERVEVPGVMESEGLPMKLHAVRSKLRRDLLMEHVYRSFENANLYIAPYQPQVSSDPQLTGLDTDRMVAFTVFFQANPDGSTTAILAESHLAERRENQRFFAPVHPSAQAPLETKVEGARTLTYGIIVPEKEVYRFYKEMLPKLGFTEEPGMKFRRGDRQITVHYSARAEGARVMLFEGPYLDDKLQPAKPR